MAELVHGERSILIGSLSVPYFAIWTTKMDRWRIDFTDLCFFGIRDQKFGYRNGISDEKTYLVTIDPAN